MTPFYLIAVLLSLFAGFEASAGLGQEVVTVTIRKTITICPATTMLPSTPS
ncbi:hypothetical protein VB005_02468 [Metarhizium brunneum]